MGRAIMVQGTASSVGKSVIAAALCRIFRNDGLSVAPFKAQNMSNNSYVTADGGEIGRAQVVQAAAARVEPCVAMNPVLLKPEADHRSQIVLLGRPHGNLDAANWPVAKQTLWPVVADALDSLLDQYEIVVIEGAGSPAEVNLRSGDIVNMRVAMHAHAPVLLVGDIDRGGVFASLHGTLELLTPEEHAAVRGLLINRFRGAREALEPLPAMIEERTGVPVVGVVPYLADLRLPEEDATALDGAGSIAGCGVSVAVVRLPHVSNFDDFLPLSMTDEAAPRYVARPQELDGAHLVILPGTKSTIADLRWMRERGLDRAVSAAAARGAAIIGICGGYQMLGETVSDPGGAEGNGPDCEAGLGMLPVETDFLPAKTTRRVRFRLNGGDGLLAGASGLEGDGYEIHMGETRPAAGACPPPAMHLRAGDRFERHGAAARNGRVLGTYVHGLFDDPDVRRTLLANAAAINGLQAPHTGAFSLDAEIERIADAVRANIDMPYVRHLVGR